jgi:hypothetical protein
VPRSRDRLAGTRSAFLDFPKCLLKREHSLFERHHCLFNIQQCLSKIGHSLFKRHSCLFNFQNPSPNIRLRMVFAFAVHVERHSSLFEMDSSLFKRHSLNFERHCRRSKRHFGIPDPGRHSPTNPFRMA